MNRLACVIVSIAVAGPCQVSTAPAHAGDVSDRDGVTADEIYDRVLKNRFSAFVQETTLISGDRSGRRQRTELRMHWKDFRDDAESRARGVLSKAIVQYTHPFDLRHSGYLVIVHAHRVNDQFVYFPSRRKVVRVNLRGEAIFGTDFSFEDIIPREFEESEYERLPDEVIAGSPVFVVQVVPNDFVDSAYSRVVVYVDPETNVVLRARYWNNAGVEIKEMHVDPSEIKEFDGVWVPMQIEMTHLLRDTYTTLSISNLLANPELPDTTFEIRRLEAH